MYDDSSACLRHLNATSTRSAHSFARPFPGCVAVMWAKCRERVGGTRETQDPGRLFPINF